MLGGDDKGLVTWIRRKKLSRYEYTMAYDFNHTHRLMYLISQWKLQYRDGHYHVTRIYIKFHVKYNQRIINRHKWHPEYFITCLSPCGLCRGVSENGEILSMFKLFFIQEGSYHFALPYTRSSNGGCLYYIIHFSEISFVHFDSSRNIKIPYLICDYILHNK